MKIRKFFVFLFVPAISFIIGAGKAVVFAQYNPTGEESIERCPNLESTTPQQDLPSGVRTYRKYDYSPLPEMRGDNGIDQNSNVRGAWCGQVKSDPILLSEEANYHLRKTTFCQIRKWIREINMNYSAPPDVNYRVPYAEEMARQWGGSWDAEHELEATIDQMERIRAGGTPGNPLTPQEEASRGQVISQIENKTGVVKMVTSLDRQDQLKRKFIDYVRSKGTNTQYQNYTINGIRLLDVVPPPLGANGRVDYASSAYKTWYDQWAKTWDKLALFPNERSDGELKFDVCDDRRYYIYYGYPEVMKMTLAANELFQTFQSKQIQDAFYQGDYADLRDPLTSSLLIGDAAIMRSSVAEAPAEETAIAQETITEEPQVSKPSFFDSIKSFIASYIPKLKNIFAQGTSGVVGGNVVGSSCFHMIPKASVSGTTVTVQGCVVSDNGKSGHMQYFINGQSQGTQTVFDTRGGGTYCFPPVTLSLSSGSQNISFGVKMDECGSAGNANGISCQFSLDNGGKLIQQCSTPTGGTCQGSTLADGSWSTNCPDQTPPQEPQKPPPEDPNSLQCKHETKGCQFGCQICNRAQVSPSDTEVHTYPKNHVILGVNWPGGASQEDPVQWTWNAEAYDNGGANCAHPGGTTYECNPKGNYSPCKACLNADGTGSLNYYIIKPKTPNKRTVDVYNLVPFLDAAWKLAADKGPSIDSGFLRIFTTETIKGTGQVNPLGCSSDENVVFDSFGNFVPNPGASEIYWGNVRPAELAVPFGASAMANYTNDWNHDGDTSPHVYMDVPKPPGIARVLFYRLGGLCNANKWVSGKGMLPFALQAKNNQPSAPQQTTTGFTQLNNAQTVAQKLATLDSSLPTNETPQVTTINDPTNLASQSVFSDIQSGDQIVVYSQAGKVVIYRPSKNAIVKEAPAIRIAVRNGTTNNDLFRGFLNDLAARAPNIIVSDLKEATKTDWGKTLLIDPSGAKKTDATTLAVALGIGLGDMPVDELAPTADFLIIYGGPELVVRNGTTNDAVLGSFQASLKAAVPTVTIAGTGPAAQTNVATSFLADPSGKRTTEAAAIAAAAGVRYSPSLQAETAPAGNVFLIVVGSDKIPTSQ